MECGYPAGKYQRSPFPASPMNMVPSGLRHVTRAFPYSILARCGRDPSVGEDWNSDFHQEEVCFRVPDYLRNDPGLLFRYRLSLGRLTEKPVLRLLARRSPPPKKCVGTLPLRLICVLAVDSNHSLFQPH